MSLLEEEYYEPTIRETDPEEPVQGSPVTVVGRDYAIVADEAQVLWKPKPSMSDQAATYLNSVVVKLAGGAGAALDEGDDYTVNLRTGVITVVPAGALDGQTEVWVEAQKTGIDDLQARQLANRTAKLKADLVVLAAEVVALDAAIGALGLGALATKDTVNNDDWSGTDLAVGNGGTGASDATNARSNLGLVIGTHVQAFHAILAALAGLAGAADKLPYFTGASAMALADLTSFGRSLIAGADASAILTLLGIAKPTVFITVTDTGTVNNYNPTGWDTCDGVLFNNGADLTITGFQAPTATGKRWKVLQCLTSNDANMVDESASSNAENRIHGSTIAVGILQSTKRSMIIAYDDSNDRWRCVFAAAS